MIEWGLRRPVAVSLLMLGIVLAGLLGFRFMPVAPLPQIEFPTLSVTTQLPGASPEVVAATVTTPLERALGTIAGVTEMTSSSSQGRSRITLQFDLDRSIDAAARDVQAAINAAVPLLPAGLPALPAWRKNNPADAPILIIAVRSAVLDRGQLYDAASTVLSQRIAQVPGVGQVDIAGGALPAVRIQVDPDRLTSLGLTMEAIRSRLGQMSVNRPLGIIEGDERSWLVTNDDQLKTAAEFRALVIRSDGSRVLRLGDVANVSESVQDVRHYGEANADPAIVLVIFKQPNANTVETVERIRAVLPVLQSQIAGTIDLTVTLDRTVTIRASLKEVERTLLISIGLVMAVTLVFLRRIRLALMAGLCVPVTLLGTCAVMYLAGFSLDNLSLMALIMVTGFVVDDAIVVLENLSRYRERGYTVMQAALAGTREIAPTVASISLALVAVFLPVLLMGGVTGRLFQPFAVILCVAVLLSMGVSLLLTSVMFAHAGAHANSAVSVVEAGRRAGFVYRRLSRWYRKSLMWSLRHPVWILLLLMVSVSASAVLYQKMPKGLFPTQDTGRISGNIQGDQSVSFAFMQQRLKTVLEILRSDPAVMAVSGFTGGGQRNYGSLFMALKPLSERKESSEAVIARLRGKLSRVTGVRVFLNSQQDVRIGGRSSSSSFEYSLKSDNVASLQSIERPIREALQKLPELTDVNSDQQNRAQQVLLTIDRDALARYGISVAQFDNHLYDAFGQRLVGLIYNPLNQYRVVLEMSPEHLTGPQGLDAVWFASSAGDLVPLSALASLSVNNAPLSVSHEAGAASLTFSFALPQGVALSQAMEAIRSRVASIGLPSNVSAGFSGTAKAQTDGERSQPLLIALTALAVYFILGMLYESFLHPLTILSTLPAAGVGALAALSLWGLEFTVIALIAVILLMGIVMKNAILMIDFALVRQRAGHLGAPAAVLKAASLRLRPILMTTCASFFGALPLALMTGDGAELRQPLGIAVVGGLLVSQLLTLYTTPVVFMMLDRLRERLTRRSARRVAAASVVALSTGLSGCAAPDRPPVLESAAVTPGFRNASDVWVDPVAQADVPASWWTLFGDEGLNRFQENVASDNAALQLAVAQLQLAQATFESSRAALFPSFSVNAGVIRSVNNLANPRGTSFSVSGVVSPWEVDIWGRVGALTAAADANRQAAAQRLAAARLSVHSQVNQTWLTLAFARAQQSLLERNEKIAARLLDLARNRVEAGIASSLEISQAQAQLSSIAAQRVAAQAQERQLFNALATLGGGGRHLPDQAGMNLALAPVPPLPELLPSTLLARRPDIQAAAHAVNAAWSTREASRVARFPVLTFSASGGYRARGFSDLLEMPAKVWSLGPTLAAPLFDGGLRKAAQAQAEAQLNAQVATWRQTVLDALQEVEDQLVSVWQFRQQAVLQADALTAATRALTLTRNQYEAGLVSLQTLLLAQQTALSAEQALLLARHQERLALNVLLKNLAGPPSGWPAIRG